jgi:glutathione S-transferase
MIRLHKFFPVWGLPSASSFCLKLETYLRMAGIPHENVSHAGPFGAPKGKLPYIEDAGRVLWDSGVIIDHLKATRGDPLDHWLNAEQSARALAFRRLIEESLYASVMYRRWVDPAGWAVQRPAYFGALPAPVRWIVAPLARRMVRRALWGHGRGRHEPTTVYAMGCDDLAAVSTTLGEQPFLMGERPCSLDAAAYGLLAHIVWVPVGGPLKDRALALGNLEPYCARIRDRWFAG